MIEQNSVQLVLTVKIMELLTPEEEREGVKYPYV